MIDYLKPVVAFDVDNTLINSDGEPRKAVVQFFTLFQRFGCRMVIWSNGQDHDGVRGVEYAKRIADRLGLQAEILEKGSLEPDICVDDLNMFDRISERIMGKVNIKV